MRCCDSNNIDKMLEMLRQEDLQDLGLSHSCGGFRVCVSALLLLKTEEHVSLKQRKSKDFNKYIAMA